MSERRRDRRIPFTGRVFELTQRGQIPCGSVNIGEGGVYIRRHEGGVLLDGEHVWLELQLPDGDKRPIWAHGQVVEQVSETFHDAASIRFRGMPDADRERLRQFVTAA